MTNSMNLLIVGTGNVGSALTKRFSRANHTVNIGSREKTRGQKIGDALGAKGGRAADLVERADVVFLAVPFSEIESAASELGPMDGKIVVDCTNPLTEDFMQLTIGHNNSAAEECQRIFPNSRIVKAFNAMFAEVVSDNPDYNGITPQVFCASDDLEAKNVVMELIKSIGYEPVDVGALVNSRYLEPLAELIIQLAYVMEEGTHITPVIARANN